MTEAASGGIKKITGQLAEYLREHLGISKALILSFLAAASIGAYASGAFDAGDRAFWDFCFKHRPAQYISPKIVVVEIDEASIRSVGRWPWDREWHASLIQALKHFGARSVAFDILFSESASPQVDALLAKVIESSKIVYLPMGYGRVEGSAAEAPIQSLPSMLRGAVGEGHTYVEPDPDGIIRGVRPSLGEGAHSRWHLGILLAVDALGLKPGDVRLKEGFLEIMPSGNAGQKIPIDTEGRLMINWPGRWTESFRRVSYHDVIRPYAAVLTGGKPESDTTIFKDAVCLVGVTASGLVDLYATPLESTYPTVGVTASVLNSLLERSALRPASRFTHLLILLVLSAALLIIMLRANYLQSFFLLGLIAFSYAIAAFFLFTRANVVLSVAYPLALILSGYATLAGYNQIVITVEKNRLLKLATTDPLTGLFNIAHFKRLLQAELLSTRLRSKKDICVVMVDGDHFKKVNDSYGHAAGDDVLRGLADILRSNCRALDVAARYGGEEFIVMLPGATLEAALKVAEKIRAGVESKKYGFGPGGSLVGFTASFGVAVFIPGESMDDLLKRADEALYLAKKSGRNCVCTV